MLRTRDFVLFLVTFSFLVVAIGATLFSRGNGDMNRNQFQLELAVNPDQEYLAYVQEAPTLSREETLQKLRAKIAASEDVTPESVETEEVSDNLLVDETASLTAVLNNESQTCSWYSEYVGVWPRSGVQSEIIEGARVFFVEVQLPATVITASGTAAATTDVQVLTQLPLPALPQSQPTCIASDVIGIARDGSLIRNNEISLYGVFDSSTIIGYALDGFPIYGTSNQATDKCGGAIVGSQYGYYLSVDREEILSCFSSSPVNL